MSSKNHLHNKRGRTNHGDSPPPRSDYMPSLKNFKVPKRNKRRELLTDVQLSSREAKEIMKTITNSFWESDAYTVEFKRVQLVYNEHLEKLYSKKRQEMKEHLRSDVTDSFAFLKLKTPQQTHKVCQKGLSTKIQHIYLPASRSCCIGDIKYGVYLSRCADVLTRLTTMDRDGDCTMVVFKYMKGRLKSVAPQYNNSLEPTYEYDGHTSVNFQLGLKMPLEKVYDVSQIYLYEVNLENMTDAEDSMYATSPRQCIPHAIVEFNAKRKVILSQVTKPPPTPSTSNIQQISSSNNRSGTDSAEETPFKYEDYLHKIRYTWQGYYFNHKRFLSEIRIGVYGNEGEKFESPNLCVTQKISWEKLSYLLPQKIYRKMPCISLKSIGCCDRKKQSYRHAEIHPPVNVGRFAAIEKLIQRWVKSKSAGVCTFSSGTKLFLIPTGELTDKLGITCLGYPPFLHCVFRSHLNVINGMNCPEYDNFIKLQKLHLRVRLHQIEEMKIAQKVSNVGRNPNGFNRSESEKLITSLDNMKKIYQKNIKEKLKISKRLAEGKPSGDDDSDDDTLTVNLNDPAVYHDDPYYTESTARMSDSNLVEPDLTEDPYIQPEYYLDGNGDYMNPLLDDDMHLNDVGDSLQNLEIPFIEVENPENIKNVETNEAPSLSNKINPVSNKKDNQNMYSDISDASQCYIEDISNTRASPMKQTALVATQLYDIGNKYYDEKTNFMSSFQNELRQKLVHSQLGINTEPHEVIYHEVSSSESLSEITASLAATMNKKRKHKDIPRAYRSPSVREDSSVSSRESPYRSKHNSDHYHHKSKSRSRSPSGSRSGSNSRSRSHSRHKSKRGNRSRSKSSSRHSSPYRSKSSKSTKSKSPQKDNRTQELSSDLHKGNEKCDSGEIQRTNKSQMTSRKSIVLEDKEANKSQETPQRFNLQEGPEAKKSERTPQSSNLPDSQDSKKTQMTPQRSTLSEVQVGSECQKIVQGSPSLEGQEANKSQKALQKSTLLETIIIDSPDEDGKISENENEVSCTSSLPPPPPIPYVPQMIKTPSPISNSPSQVKETKEYIGQIKELHDRLKLGKQLQHLQEKKSIDRVSQLSEVEKGKRENQEKKEEKASEGNDFSKWINDYWL